MRSHTLWLVVPFALRASALVSPIHRNGLQDVTVTDTTHNEHSDCHFLGGDVNHFAGQYSDPASGSSSTGGTGDRLAHCGEPAPSGTETQVGASTNVNGQQPALVDNPSSSTSAPNSSTDSEEPAAKVGCTVNDKYFAGPLSISNQLDLGLIQPPAGMDASLLLGLLQNCVESDSVSDTAGHTGISTGASGINLVGPGGLDLGTGAVGLSGIFQPVNGILGGVQAGLILGNVNPIGAGGARSGIEESLGGLNIGGGGIDGGILPGFESDKPVTVDHSISTSPPNYEHSAEGTNDLDVGVADDSGRAAHGNVTPTSSRGPLSIFDNLLSHFRSNTNSGITNNNGDDSKTQNEGGKQCVNCGIPV